MTAITAHDKLACAMRELALRKRNYPKWVEQGKLKADEAEHEIEVMHEICLDYSRQIHPEIVGDMNVTEPIDKLR